MSYSERTKSCGSVSYRFQGAIVEVVLEEEKLPVVMVGRRGLVWLNAIYTVSESGGVCNGRPSSYSSLWCRKLLATC